MTRFVDRGAVTAAYVGIGMAVTIAISYERILAAMEPSDRWVFANVPAQLRERARGNASQPG